MYLSITFYTKKSKGSKWIEKEHYCEFLSVEEWKKMEYNNRICKVLASREIVKRSYCKHGFGVYSIDSYSPDGLQKCHMQVHDVNNSAYGVYVIGDSGHIAAVLFTSNRDPEKIKARLEAEEIAHDYIKAYSDMIYYGYEIIIVNNYTDEIKSRYILKKNDINRLNYNFVNNSGENE